MSELKSLPEVHGSVITTNDPFLFASQLDTNYTEQKVNVSQAMYGGGILCLRSSLEQN